MELHLHLEGAIPLDALWQLVQKYGTDPSVTSLQSLRRKFQYKDFPHFIETWIWKNQFLREYDDFTFIAQAVARNLARQNIRYAEMFYSASRFFGHGLETQKLTEAVRAGLGRVKQIEIGLILDFVRDNGPENAAKNLSEVNEVKQLGVIGIGIGGSEQSYPPEPFADVYELEGCSKFRLRRDRGSPLKMTPVSFRHKVPIMQGRSNREVGGVYGSGQTGAFCTCEQNRAALRRRSPGPSDRCACRR